MTRFWRRCRCSWSSARPARATRSAGAPALRQLVVEVAAEGVHGVAISDVHGEEPLLLLCVCRQQLLETQVNQVVIKVLVVLQTVQVSAVDGDGVLTNDTNI